MSLYDKILAEQTQMETGAKAVPLTTIALKALITCISIALLILFMFFLTFLATGGFDEFFEQFDLEQHSFFMSIGFDTLAAYCFLAIVYAFSKCFYGSMFTRTYCFLFRKAGLAVPFLAFFFLAASSIGIYAGAGIPPLAGIAICLLESTIAFCPIIATWNVFDEERLKNFIDSMSKTLSCIVVLSGGIAVIAKLLSGF